MKKRRFRLVIAGAILIAPPLGGFFCVLQFMVASLFTGGVEGFAGLWGVLLAYMLLSYLLGFIPALVVGIYAAWIASKARVFRIYRIYLLSFFLTALNLLLFSGGSLERLVHIFSLVTITSMTASFFTLYYLSKKLLPWAGTSLIEPTKAGRP